MKKRILIILCVVVVFIVIITFLKRYGYQLPNLYFKVRMIGVNKDITVHERGGHSMLDTNEGGYATSSYEYWIDIKKKKIYKIEDYDIWGSSTNYGHHYSLLKTKKLSTEVLNEIIELTKLESDYKEKLWGNTPAETIERINYVEPIHYVIEYQDKTTKLQASSAKVLEQVINSLH